VWNVWNLFGVKEGGGNDGGMEQQRARFGGLRRQPSTGNIQFLMRKAGQELIQPNRPIRLPAYDEFETQSYQCHGTAGSTIVGLGGMVCDILESIYPKCSLSFSQLTLFACSVMC
jgi:hypothetical protein